MDRTKSFSLILIGAMVISCVGLLAVKPTNAQTVPTPFIPQLMLFPRDTLVQIYISDQPIIPNGYNTANIFFNIRIKNHQSDNWVNTTVPNPSQGVRGYIEEIGTTGYTITYEDFSSIRALLALPNNISQIDFQVEAINGYLNTTISSPFGNDPNNTPVIIVNISGWSTTQTITIPASSSSPVLTSAPTTSPNTSPTATPAVPELSWLVIVPLLLSLFSVAVIVRHRKPEIQAE